ncbi:MAG: hypothetical protein ACM3IH_20880 [Sphingobacteriales bacterium]
MDLLVVPTIGFDLLYALVIVRLPHPMGMPQSAGVQSILPSDAV